MTQPANAILRLREITERKGQKITARDIATAHLAIAALEHLQERGQHGLERLMLEMVEKDLGHNTPVIPDGAKRRSGIHA